MKARQPAAQQPGPAPRARSLPATPESLLAQRLGNRGLHRLLLAHRMQAKLTISDAGDVLEQEADRVADQVMRMPDAGRPSIQRQCHGCEDELQRQSTVDAAGGQSVHPGLEHSIAALAGRGNALPESVRSFMEPRFEADFSAVRVHTDVHAQSLARSVAAKAFTVGRDVVFGAGEYAPQTASGLHLIAHELTHVIQQTDRGGTSTTIARAPSPPPKKPDPPTPKLRNPHDELAKIIERASAVKDLAAWLDVHPTDLQLAERFLLDKARIATTQPGWDRLSELLGEVFKRDPTSHRARESLRTAAENSADALWLQYSKGAAIAAISQWAADPAERSRILAQLHTPAEKQAKTKALAALQTDSAKLLKAARQEREALLRDLQHKVSILPLRNNATFTPTEEQDLVARLLHQMERGIARAEGLRVRSFQDYSARKPDKNAAAEIALLNKQRDAADAAVQAAQQELDAANKLNGAHAAARVRASTDKLTKARARQQAAAAARGKASPAASRAIRYQEDPLEKQRIDTAVTAAANARNVYLEDQAASLPGFNALVDDEASWWIYWRAIANARDGFDGFAMEHTLRPLLLARNKTIDQPRATGIDAATSSDTYAGHGWGQYDLNAPAGTSVTVAQPPTIDLSQVLRGNARTFEWVGSRVSSVFGQDPRQTEKDVLDKLAYGFFGRDRSFEQKIVQTDLDSGELPKGRSPEPNRLVAGLLYRNTVAGAELEIEERLIELRADLEQQLEEAAEFSQLRRNDQEEILRQTFDASAGDFGTANLLNPAAFVAAGARGSVPAAAIKAFNTVVARILKEDSDFTRAVFTLLQERIAALKASGGVEAGHKGVLDWAGPSVYVVHHYRVKGGTEEAWIRVIYLHLHKTTAKVGKESKDALTVGEVGSGGNAISPHVHMSIAVFDREPSWNTQPIDYLDPTDFFGMVPRSPFKTRP